MKIKLTLKDLIKSLIFIILLINIFSGMLIDINPIFKSLATISLIFELLAVLLFTVSHCRKIKLDCTTIIAVFFLCWSLLSFVVSTGGFYYLFERYRYILVGIILFWLVREYISTEFITKVMDLLLVIQLINAILTIYQNEILGLHPDFCNGIFGTYDYFNSSQGILSLLISCLSIIHYIYNTWNRKKCILAIILSFIVCAFSEVKAFYIIFIIDFLIITILQINNKALMKKVIRIMIIAILAFYIAWQILSIVMPQNLQYFTNLQLYFAYEDYGARGGAGRINAFSYVYKNVFDSNFFSALIGKGIGSATGQYAYEFPLLFHEEGLIGVGLLIAFFISIMIDGLKYCKKSRIKPFGIFLIVWSVSIIISLFIWNAVFAKPMSLVFVFLGVGYIWKNNSIGKVREKNEY